MTWRMQNRNLDKYHKHMKYCQILKKEKHMIPMVLMDLNSRERVVSIFQMLIVYLKDSSEILDLITKKIKISLVPFLVEEIEMEKKDLGLVLVQCLIMMIFLKQDSEV